MKKPIYLAFIISLIANLTACGTILYPERKGQRGGQLDAAVVVLDGIGLLFFLVPGVIAYAVDFATGTIYLPGGRRANLEDDINKNTMVALHLGKEKLSGKNIERAIYAQTGKVIDTHSADIEVYKMDATGQKVKVDNPLS